MVVSTLCTRIGRWRGNPPKAQCSMKLKTSTSCEWHASTLTHIFLSTLRNALAVVTEHNAMVEYALGVSLFHGSSGGPVFVLGKLRMLAFGVWHRARGMQEAVLLDGERRGRGVAPRDRRE